MGAESEEAFGEVSSSTHDQCLSPTADSHFAPLLRFNAANYVHKWSTPQLIIHGSKDYRLPETEGIGAFHALQQYVFLVFLRYDPHAQTTLLFRRGVPSRLVIFPDENHWVLDHGNR